MQKDDLTNVSASWVFQRPPSNLSDWYYDYDNEIREINKSVILTSYDIVKAHGGELKVESEEGEGAEFWIILPID